MASSTEHRLANKRSVIVLTAWWEVLWNWAVTGLGACALFLWAVLVVPWLYPGAAAGPFTWYSLMLSGLVNAAVVGLLPCFLVPLGLMDVLLLLQCDFCWWVQSHANIAAQHHSQHAVCGCFVASWCICCWWGVCVLAVGCLLAALCWCVHPNGAHACWGDAGNSFCDARAGGCGCCSHYINFVFFPTSFWTVFQQFIVLNSKVCKKVCM